MATQKDVVTKTGLQSADDPFEFVMSTETPDRSGDVVVQAGWDLRQFRKNPIALFGHDPRNVIGTWEKVRVVNNQLIGRLKMARAGTSQLVDEVRALLEQRILKAVSVGFSPIKAEPLDKDNPWGGYRFEKQELLETSVVAVPANSEALSVAKSMNLSPETLRLLSGEIGTVSGARKAQRRTVKGALPSKLKSKGHAMKLGDKIVSAEERIAELRDTIADILKTAEDEGRGDDLNEGEVEQLAALEGEIAAAQTSLDGLKAAEKALASRAAKNDGTPAPRPSVPARVAEKEEPGSLFIKQAVVTLQAKQQNRHPLEVQAERYGNDPRVEAIIKAATEPANTTASGWATELTRTDTVGFINVLTGTSVFGPIANAGMMIPFGDANAVMVPRRAGRGNVKGSFVQEGATIPVKNDVIGSVTMNRYKMSVIVPFTNELARVSNPQIEALLRRSIVDDTTEAIDTYMLNPAMALNPGVAPASPFNGATTQASTGATGDDIVADLRFLIDTVASADGGRANFLVMHPLRHSALVSLRTATGSFVFREEVASGTIFGVPIIVSTHCPTDHVFIIDAADLASAMGAPEFFASEHTSLVMADDDGVAPTMTATGMVDTAGSLNISDAATTVPPTAVVSMLQTYSTALRMVLPISWMPVRDGTRAYITAVAW